MTFDEWWKKEHFTPCDFRYGLVKAAWQAATLAEREECAKVAEKKTWLSRASLSSILGDEATANCDIAQAIRARSNEGENDV